MRCQPKEEKNMRREPHRRRRLSRSTVRLAVFALSLVSLLALGAYVAPWSQARGQAAPVNTMEPTIVGQSVVGQKLTAANGSWSGSPTSFDYQWLRCDGAGASCSPLAGATTSAYTLGGDDVDRRMRVRVTATNADGSTTAQSNPTDAVKPAPQAGKPVNMKAPSVSGTAAEGQELRAASGEWSGSQPLTFSFRWLRCDGAGNNCVAIGGATGDTYTVRAADVGKTIRVRVTARNAAGTASTLAPQTAAVQGGADGLTGAIKLPNGETSIPVTSVPATERLVVDQVEFTPTVVRSRTQTFTVRIKVKDTRRLVVRDARVFIRSTPLVTRRVDDRDSSTSQDGWVTVSMQPERDFPALNPSYAVQFYVKAYRAGDPVLAGVAGARLVQVPLGR
jgi:hypothetical protein